MAQRKSTWPIVTIVIAVLALIVALPTSWKSWAPSFLKPEFSLGLDLAGGTQLDFRISEDQIKARIAKLQEEISVLERSGDTESLAQKRSDLLSTQEQYKNLVEAIRTVLERRINSLGVSEATVTPSYYGEEKHLLVDCPGVIDPAKCAATVGKTIQLEFKEQFTEATDDFKAKVKEKANETFKDLQAGSGTLKTIGEDMSNDLGVAYQDAQPYFQDELPQGLEAAWGRKVGDAPVLSNGTISSVRANAQGQQEVVNVEGTYISEVVQAPVPATRTIQDPHIALEMLSKTGSGVFLTQEKQPLEKADPLLQTALTSQALGSHSVVTMGNDHAILYIRSRVDGKEEATASHILVQYKGAERADTGVTRTKEEAKARAESLLTQLKGGADFKALASKESDGSTKANGGSLGTFERGTWPEFETSVFALKKEQISNVVESPFGFHIFRADEDVKRSGTTVSYDLLRFAGANSETIAKAQNDAITKGIAKTDNQITLRVLFFSLEPTGWKDTELNGEHFRSASVVTDNTTRIPIVQILFDEEGAKLFQELTKKNINKPIAIFVGGELVSAPTVQQEIAGGTAVITGSSTYEEANKLATDLNTGAIPAPIHLTGQNTIEATLGSAAVQDSLKAAIIGFIVLAFFMLVIYRVLGAIAVGALTLYVILLIALMKLPLLLITQHNIVLTLAGIAGIILSIGMAVDANVLIFERMKEEMKKGKSLTTAADTGFKRAWPSIRDGNSSTLITSAILFVIGTSIIRGFAVTLAMGIVLSLFTAIVVTRWLLHRILESPMAERNELFGGRKEGSAE